MTASPRKAIRRMSEKRLRALGGRAFSTVSKPSSPPRRSAENPEQRKGRWRPHNATKTHCLHGHEFTPENTRVHTKRGWVERYCRQCKRDRSTAPKRSRKPIPERFWSHVQRGEGCWEWRGARSQRGYGFLYRTSERLPGDRGLLPQQRVFAHRVAWTLTRGPIPEGMLVCHHCDNPPCVNPEHLFLGTDADNHADMVAKGRARNGSMSKTHCKRGHEFTPENTARFASSPQRRICRACYRLAHPRTRARRSAA